VAWVAAALGLLFAGATALLALRVRVRAQVKAMVHAAGGWRAAAGGAVGPIAFTAGVSPEGSAWTAHVLGRSVARGRRLPKAPGRGRVSLTGDRALDVATVALRRVRFDRLDARVHGAADDPATSARVMGLLAAASALVPRARVSTDIDWLADAAFVDVDCDMEASFVPLLVGWDMARLAVERRKERRKA
jgi:hypothetical protein